MYCRDSPITMLFTAEQGVYLARWHCSHPNPGYNPVRHRLLITPIYGDGPPVSQAASGSPVALEPIFAASLLTRVNPCAKEGLICYSLLFCLCSGLLVALAPARHGQGCCLPDGSLHHTMSRTAATADRQAFKHRVSIASEIDLRRGVPRDVGGVDIYGRVSGQPSLPRAPGTGSELEPLSLSAAMPGASDGHQPHRRGDDATISSVPLGRLRVHRAPRRAEASEIDLVTCTTPFLQPGPHAPDKHIDFRGVGIFHNIPQCAPVCCRGFIPL